MPTNNSWTSTLSAPQESAPSNNNTITGRSGDMVWVDEAVPARALPSWYSIPPMRAYDNPFGTPSPLPPPPAAPQTQLQVLENMRDTYQRQIDTLLAAQREREERDRAVNVRRQRREYTQVLANNGTTTEHQEYFNGEESYTTTADASMLAQWLDNMRGTHGATNVRWDDCGLYVTWTETVPLTTAQREEAEAYLRDNPEPEHTRTAAPITTDVLDAASYLRLDTPQMERAIANMRNRLLTTSGSTIRWREPARLTFS